MNDELATPSVKANCPDCGDVIVMAGDIRVVVQEGRDDGVYAFRCPDCLWLVSQAAEVAAVEILVLAGSSLVLCAFPAEALEPHAGLPFTGDDLIDFHFELQMDDWFDRVRSGPGAGCDKP